MVKIDDPYSITVSKVKLKNKDSDSKPKKEKKKKNFNLNVFKEAETIDGTGRIVSSQVTVQGFETFFLDEIQIGDVLIVSNIQSLHTEERTVINIISQRVLEISSKFTLDVVSTSSYKIRKESSIIEDMAIEKVSNMELTDDDDGTISAKLLVEEKTRLLFERIDAEKKVIEVREKTGTSYKIRSEIVAGGKSQEALLDLREKKTRDKYCW